MVDHKLMQLLINGPSKCYHIHKVNNRHGVSVICEVIKAGIGFIKFDYGTELIDLSLPQKALARILEEAAPPSVGNGTP